MERIIVGLSGLAGSGKDLSADFLMTDHGFVKVALADPLKRICREVYNFTDEQLWGPSHCRNAPDERYPRLCKDCYGVGDLVTEDGVQPCFGCHGERVTYLSPREALQKIGTEWGRECYPNTWVDLAIRTAKDILAFPNESNYNQKDGFWLEQRDTPPIMGVSIPDVRFRNEMTAIRTAGGKMIRVLRPGAGLSGVHGAHKSETEQMEIPDSEFDLVIINDGTVNDLRAKLASFIRGL